MTTPEAPTTEVGHDHTSDCECLPIRVVVDQHGHYWRDYGDHWSMCPVSTENVATDSVTDFYRLGEGGDFETDTLDVDRLAEAMATCDGVNWPKRWSTNESHDFSWVARQVAAKYRALAPADAAGREAHKHGPLTWKHGAKSDGGGWECDVCGAFPVEIGA